MNEGEENVAIEAGATGASEGAFTEPTAEEIAELYKATGVKAPVPTDKSKKRSKTSDGGDKKASKEDDGSSESGKGQKADDSKDKSKAASASGSDGSDGDDVDEKSKKVSKADGKNGQEDSEVSGDGDEDAKGVSDSKSKDNQDASKTGEDDVEQGAERSGQKSDDEDGEAEEGKDDEVKRPGKSNPEVEKRFQKLTEEKRAAEQRAAELEKRLQEKDEIVEKAKLAQEDPEYTIDDFRKVQNSEGEIIELDANQAELAWRRWKDGYDQRSEERQAEANRAAARAEHQAEVERQVMEESVKAYDTLASLQDEFPELVTGDSYDPDFAAEAMPIVEESIQYLEGTEPGNAEDKLPVIIGLKINPKQILTALKNINTKKRSLPLNGVNDNVESGSNVSVTHSRSSDPTVQAANDLYKELGIKKRL